MPRNLDNRIEVLTPVYDKVIQAELKRVVCYGLRDTAKGRIVDGSGDNKTWETAMHLSARRKNYTNTIKNQNEKGKLCRHRHWLQCRAATDKECK